MHYPFYEDNWPAFEPGLDDKRLLLKAVQRNGDMRKKSECFKKGSCEDDCELIYCHIRNVFKSKTMTHQQFAEKTLRGLQRSAVTLTDELDILQSGYEEVEDGVDM